MEQTDGLEPVQLKDKDLQVKNLSFRYEEKNVLSNLSFTIPQGKTTALVGPSGSGKSTLLTLLDRFYQPTDGAIQADGIDIGAYGLHPWRTAISYVSQDTVLYSGTVRENILYGLDHDVSEVEFTAACDAACVTEFVKELEHGFDTQVGEGGSKLSGGQRQRVSIARAILRDPDLLLLDEVTANLDTESEARVNQALRRLSQGRTTVTVAHRLNTVQDADQIVVLAEGRVQGVGQHQELMRTNTL